MAKVFKKSLSLLSVSLASTMLTTSVVSCGAGLDKLLNRIVDTKVYKSVYSFGIESFNTAKTMQAEDHVYLANMYDTILSMDEYGRIYGALAESEYGASKHPGDKSYEYIGDTQDNGLTWTYKFRDDLYWYDKDGNKKAEIKAYDEIMNTARFALNQNNGSDIVELWTSFIDGAQEIYDEIRAIIKTGDDVTNKINAIWAAVDAGTREFGIKKTNDVKNGVTFKLTKAAPYFESLLTYSCFSPSAAINLTNTRDNWQANWFNGAYLPVQFDEKGKYVLKKNENYLLKDNVKIERLEFNYDAGGSSSKGRTLFESGATSGFAVNSDDAKGWKDYIGNDIDNPKFEAAYSTPSPDKQGTFNLFYNFSNPSNVSGSRLLQSKAVRNFINSSLDRTEFVRYYSKAFDGDSKQSKQLRNTYTGVSLADHNGKDYASYVSDVYDKKVGGESSSKDGSYTIQDGTDPYLNNSQKLNGRTQEQLISDINAFKKGNDLGTGKTELKILLSASNGSSINPFVESMLQKFNNISNNPISIVSDVATDTNAYREKSNKGDFDLYIGGWSPDYKDPSTFLTTQTLNGALSNYNGNVRLFANVREEIKAEGPTLNDEKYRTTGTKALYDSWLGYSNSVDQTDRELTADNDARYKAFAQTEYNFIFDQSIILPLYTRARPKNYAVSYLAPYSKVYEGIGISQSKFYNAYLTEKLLRKNELDTLVANYLKAKAEVDADWTTHRDAAHWAKSGNQN